MVNWPYRGFKAIPGARAGPDFCASIRRCREGRASWQAAGGALGGGGRVGFSRLLGGEFGAAVLVTATPLPWGAFIIFPAGGSL